MIYSFDEYQLDTEAYTLMRGGNPVKLEPQVFDVLTHLIESHGRVVSKEDLLDKVWGDRFVGEAALNSRVMAARKAIGDSGKEQRLIRTVHGRGYSFVGKVNEGPAARPESGKPTGDTDIAPEPAIQYAQSSDGTSIAYWTIGEGEPIVVMPDIPISNIQLEWQLAGTRAWYQRLAQSGRVVRYDGRGMGLSDRNVTDFSIEAQAADLDAIADRAGLQNFTILAQFHGSCVALAYCSLHPGRVSRLMLWCGYARAADLHWTRALGGLMKKEWEVYTETLASTLVGWGEPARRYARFIRESVGQEQLVAHWEEIRRFDVSNLLPYLTVPTLLLHRREIALAGIDVARRLASSIPNAELVIVEGGSARIWDETDAAPRAIERFIRDRPVSLASAPESGTAIILFADIVDSTALTERLGDASFREKARDLDAALRTIIRDKGGTPIEGKLLGDGVLATFASARQAIEAALACGRAGDDGGLPLHLGLHAGDVIREEGNVFGGAVNIAARIAGESAAGEVLVSQTVRDLARTSAGVAFEDGGERELKGVGEPVRVWSVRNA